MIHSIFSKLFVGGEWYSAYRKCTDIQGKFKIVPTNSEYWIADPFWVENKGEHYLFGEIYFKKANRGGIGYYKMVNDIPVYQGMVIENPYHMSYPCVFSVGETYYMIPETSANQTIELYRAERFPDKWVLDKVLIRGEHYVDSTIYEQNGCYYLLSYQKQNTGFSLKLFLLDMEMKELTPVGEKLYNKNVGRPGGGVFYEKGALLRPAQNCSGKYGEGLYFYKLTQLNEHGISEEEVAYISINQIPIDRKYDRVHTYNRDSTYEVVDVFKEQFDLLRAFKILRRRNSARVKQ